MAVAICCGLVVFKFYYPLVYVGLGIFYFVYAVILFFAEDGVRDWLIKYKRPSIVETMQAEKPYIEKTREFFGLLIVTGALMIDYIAVKY
ncbi:hypothetical protein RG47T_0640 [Mucilaginibacter polytrichastri]|uniref:Uncharacterized protein n=2 Tax=Mucilaginibacter polytrichastri TaxID=1302689 RepID=A0A1Q5ZTW2_9SPHI|nr:hypothetical protein RG47T_0640 [Mucilaginibacter polytrichastri]